MWVDNNHIRGNSRTCLLLHNQKLLATNRLHTANTNSYISDPDYWKLKFLLYNEVGRVDADEDENEDEEEDEDIAKDEGKLDAEND